MYGKAIDTRYTMQMGHRKIKTHAFEMGDKNLSLADVNGGERRRPE